MATTAVLTREHSRCFWNLGFQAAFFVFVLSVWPLFHPFQAFNNLMMVMQLLRNSSGVFFSGFISPTMLSKVCRSFGRWQKVV